MTEGYAQPSAPSQPRPGRRGSEDGRKRHWDKSSEMFGRMGIVGKDSDYIKGVLSFCGDVSGASVLDIGCGTGIWSLGLADDVDRIVGVDISDAMVERAIRNCEANEIHNAEFVVADWKDLIPGEGVLSERFDIVIVHMAPALKNMDDLEKVLEVCKGCCFYTTGVKRTSNVRDRLDRLCPDRVPQPRNFLYRIMDRLLDDGIRPEVFYDTSEYSMEYTLNGIVDLYRDMYRELTVEQMRDALRPLVSKGKVNHKIELECITLCWRADGGRPQHGNRRERPQDSQDRGAPDRGFPENEVRALVQEHHRIRPLQGGWGVQGDVLQQVRLHGGPLGCLH